MTESVIAGTELKLIVRIEPDGVMSIEWDKMPGKFLFHEGFGAILQRGAEGSDTEGMVELQRINVDTTLEAAGHVEPLLSL